MTLWLKHLTGQYFVGMKSLNPSGSGIDSLIKINYGIQMIVISLNPSVAGIDSLIDAVQTTDLSQPKS